MLERFAGSEISLDVPARSQALGTTTIGDSLSDAFAPGPERRVEEAEFSHVLRSKLKTFEATLQGREALIFRQRLLNDEPTTLSELATKFGVTRERTRQVEQRLKARIRRYLQEELGDDFQLPAHGRGRPKMIARARALSPVSS
jgi:RNA polymerase sigma-32 factor